MILRGHWGKPACGTSAHLTFKRCHNLCLLLFVDTFVGMVAADGVILLALFDFCFPSMVPAEHETAEKSSEPNTFF